MSTFSQNDNDFGGENAQTPLMAQQGQQGSEGLETFGGESSADDGAHKRLLSNALLLLFVVGVAGGVFTIMRSYGKGANVVIADVKIDYPLTGQGPGADHVEVLKNLKTADSAVQVPLEEVRQNPFEIVGAETRETRSTGDPAGDRARQRLRTIEQRFANLRLNSVLYGSSPIARVSGEAVRVGDTVGEFFTVSAINPRSVELRADDRVYILTLGGR